MMKKYLLPLAALSAIGLTSAADAARGGNRDCYNCPPEPPAPCYTSSCCDPVYCLGPEVVNPSVRPRTCDGDIQITLAGFYWNVHQDGMEYAVLTGVTIPENPTFNNLGALNNIVDGEFKNPRSKWDFGFKAGLAYNSPCDGWDIGILWTWYRGRGRSHDEAEPCDNSSLIPLWSAYAPPIGGTLYACDIRTDWKVQINLIDIELGREFWTSKYLTLRPFVGLRIAYIKQDFNLEHRGGSWSVNSNISNSTAFNNFVDIDNRFRGVGLRSGLDTVWNLGCGWAFYGNLAASIVYGRFKVDHDEDNKLASDPHSDTSVYEAKSSFRSSKAMLDLALGLQWSTMFCDCDYAFSAKFGWEQHLFFGQNQMWRTVRIGDTNVGVQQTNNTGENVFHQRRGDLDTQGWTLTFTFGF